jgi:hypothetical protein
MLIGMFSILAAWIFLWLVIFGLGLLLIRLIAFEIKGAEEFFAVFWLGLTLSYNSYPGPYLSQI